MKASARMQKNAAVSRALAAESMVLLKNTLGTLPLAGTPSAWARSTPSRAAPDPATSTT